MKRPTFLRPVLITLTTKNKSLDGHLSSTGFVELDPRAVSDWPPKLSRVLLITGTAGHRHTWVLSLQTREAGLRVTSRRSTTNYVGGDKAAINDTNSEGGVKQEVEKTVQMLSLCLTFVVRQLPDDPGLLMSVQVDIQNVTKSLWVQVTPSPDHPRWRKSTLPPGNVGHDVNWTQKTDMLTHQEANEQRLV